MSEQKHDFIWRLEGSTAIDKGFMEDFEKAADNYAFLTIAYEKINKGILKVLKEEFETVSWFKRWWYDDNYISYANASSWGINLKPRISKKFNFSRRQHDTFHYYNPVENNKALFVEIDRSRRYYNEQKHFFGEYTSLYVKDTWIKFIQKFGDGTLSDYLSHEDFFVGTHNERLIVDEEFYEVFKRRVDLK